MTTPILGVTGPQPGFIEKCWREADPDGVGQLRGSGGNKSSGTTTRVGVTPAAPLLPQLVRGNKSTANPVAIPLRPRDPVPGEHDASSATPPEPPVVPDDLPSEWHFEWDERAAIMEYDGKLPRPQAEALALADILKRMKAQEGQA